MWVIHIRGITGEAQSLGIHPQGVLQAVGVGQPGPSLRQPSNRSRESAPQRWSGKRSGRGLEDALFRVKRLLSTSGPDAVDTE